MSIDELQREIDHLTARVEAAERALGALIDGTYAARVYLRPNPPKP